MGGGGYFMVKKHFYSPAGGYGGTFDGLSKHPDRVREAEHRKEMKSRRVNPNNNNMPVYNPKNKTEYSELGSVIGYLVLAVIALTLLVFFWWILIPIGVILGIYLLTKKS